LHYRTCIYAISAINALRFINLNRIAQLADFFIALARAQGIPARELEGAAFSTSPELKPLSLSQDILHAWPEYYDEQKQSWIQVDPTWANTTGGIDYFNKLDLNHFVFVIHGSDPLKPPPAGSYKKSDSSKKDIFFIPTEPQNFPKPDIQSTIFSESDKISLTIKNNSGVGLSGPLALDFNNQTIYKNNIILAAFEVKTLSIPISISDSNKIILTINNIEYPFDDQKQKYKPNFFVATSIIFLFLAFFIWSLYLRRKKQNTPIYW